VTNNVKAGLVGVLPLIPSEPWRQFAAHPELNPLKDCCILVSSWRNLFIKVDFGQGGPTLIVGRAAPHQGLFCQVMEAPEGDGVLCPISFCDGDFERLQSSQVLQHVAPEASFVQAPSQLT